MSTILKALRRLEQEDGDDTSKSSRAADASPHASPQASAGTDPTAEAARELRTRIFTEETAARAAAGEAGPVAERTSGAASARARSLWQSVTGMAVFSLALLGALVFWFLRPESPTPLETEPVEVAAASPTPPAREARPAAGVAQPRIRPVPAPIVFAETGAEMGAETGAESAREAANEAAGSARSAVAAGPEPTQAADASVPVAPAAVVPTAAAEALRTASRTATESTTAAATSASPPALSASASASPSASASTPVATLPSRPGTQPTTPSATPSATPPTRTRTPAPPAPTVAATEPAPRAAQAPEAARPIPVLPTPAPAPPRQVAEATSRPKPRTPERAPAPVSASSTSDRTGSTRPAAGRARSSAPATPTRSASSATPDVERIDHRGLPDVNVVRTAWHPMPDKRSARIQVGDSDAAPLELREGDAVGGLVILEITPSAVLFQAGDVEVRRRVGADPR